jgi:hypothetical protein
MQLKMDLIHNQLHVEIYFSNIQKQNIYYAGFKLFCILCNVKFETIEKKMFLDTTQKSEWNPW